eukprot:scaffold56720_cov56-Attheya_sp.AAC.4
MPSSLEKFCFEADATLSEVVKLSDAELKAISKGILAYTTVQHACLIKAWRDAKQDSQEQQQQQQSSQSQSQSSPQSPQQQDVGTVRMTAEGNNTKEDPDDKNPMKDSTSTNIPSSVVEESTTTNTTNNNGGVAGVGGGADNANEQGWKEDSSLASAAAILRGVTASPHNNDMAGWSYPPSTPSMSTSTSTSYGGSSPLKKRGKSRSRPSPTKGGSSATKKAKTTSSSKKNKASNTSSSNASSNNGGGGEEGVAVVESPVDRQKAATAIAALNVANGGKNTKAATLAAAILRGVTQRQSGKWQAQLYYAGQSRYIGVFDTREKAALAYEIFREKLKTDSKPPSERSMQDEAVRVAREAAFQGVGERDLRQQQNQNQVDVVVDHPSADVVPSSTSLAGTSSCPPFATMVVTPDSSKKKSVSVSRRGGRARINPSVSSDSTIKKNNGGLEHDTHHSSESVTTTPSSKSGGGPISNSSGSVGPTGIRNNLMEYETYDGTSPIKKLEDDTSVPQSPPNLKA